MIGRYNPHEIQKKKPDWTPLPEELKEDVVHEVLTRFRHEWYGPVCSWSPFQVQLPLPLSVRREYGEDVARLTCLTSCDESFAEAHQEAAYRWIAHFFAEGHLTQPVALSEGEQERLWLRSALEAGDHLLERKKIAPALGTLKGAWKKSPLRTSVLPRLQHLILGLFSPFVPVLTSFFRERYALPHLPIGEMLREFSDWVPLRLGFAGGGWRWEVVAREVWQREPRGCLLEIPWIRRAVTGDGWMLNHVEKGWQICLNLPRKK
jgi:hypothetical protein